MKLELYNGGRKIDVEVTPAGEDLGVSFEGRGYSVRLARASAADTVLALVDGKELAVVIEQETESALKLTVGGRPITIGRAQVQVQQGLTGREEAAPTVAEQDALVSPLFGKVISVDVKVGDSVNSGQSLLVLEAMKMESVIRADGKHTIKEILVKQGDGVNKGQVLMRFA